MSFQSIMRVFSFVSITATLKSDPENCENSKNWDVKYVLGNNFGPQVTVQAFTPSFIILYTKTNEKSGIQPLIIVQ